MIARHWRGWTEVQDAEAYEISAKGQGASQPEGY